MKTKTWFNAIRVLIVVFLITAMSSMIIACDSFKKNNGDSTSGTQSSESTTDENTSTGNVEGTGTVSAVFYNETNDGENLIVLSNGNVTMVCDGENLAGICDQEGMNFTFTFKGKIVTATKNGNQLAVTYDGTVTNYFEKVYYGVEYNSNNGSAVEAMSVLNGKTVNKPADPTKEGYIFLGWEYQNGNIIQPGDLVTSSITEKTVLNIKKSSLSELIFFAANIFQC